MKNILRKIFGESLKIIFFEKNRFWSYFMEKIGFISFFIGKKPNTSYKVTTQGRSAFQEHINALEKLIKGL